MDAESLEQEMIEGTTYAKLVSSESVIVQVQPYLSVKPPISTEAPKDTDQGTEGHKSKVAEDTTKDQKSQAPSSTKNVIAETPSTETPKDTTTAIGTDQSVASTEQPTEGQQASQALVLVHPTKGKEKKVRKHSFKIDLTKLIVLPNVDISKLKGQALTDFNELCKAKAEQEKQLAIQKKNKVL